MTVMHAGCLDECRSLIGLHLHRVNFDLACIIYCIALQWLAYTETWVLTELIKGFIYTRHKIGHFCDVLPIAISLLAIVGHIYRPY